MVATAAPASGRKFEDPKAKGSLMEADAAVMPERYVGHWADKAANCYISADRGVQLPISPLAFGGRELVRVEGYSDHPAVVVTVKEDDGGDEARIFLDISLDSQRLKVRHGKTVTDFRRCPPVDLAGIGEDENPAAVRALGEGVTWTDSGILVFGSWGQRKSYVQLDAVMVPEAFLGAWAAISTQCTDEQTWLPRNEKRAGGHLLITRSYIITGNGHFPYLSTLVEAEGRISTKQLKGDKRLRLKASRFRRSDHIVLAFADEQHIVRLLSLRLEEPDRVTVQVDGKGKREFSRCVD
jgi:hypothetical protein